MLRVKLASKINIMLCVKRYSHDIMQNYDYVVSLSAPKGDQV